jgi:hypothetical protein
MTHTSRSVKRRVKRRASKSVKRKLKQRQSRRHKSNKVMFGGGNYTSVMFNCHVCNLTEVETNKGILGPHNLVATMMVTFDKNKTPVRYSLLSNYQQCVGVKHKWGEREDAKCVDETLLSYGIISGKKTEVTSRWPSLNYPPELFNLVSQLNPFHPYTIAGYDRKKAFKKLLEYLIRDEEHKTKISSVEIREYNGHDDIARGRMEVVDKTEMPLQYVSIGKGLFWGGWKLSCYNDNNNYKDTVDFGKSDPFAIPFNEEKQIFTIPFSNTPTAAPVPALAEAKEQTDTTDTTVTTRSNFENERNEEGYGFYIARHNGDATFEQNSNKEEDYTNLLFMAGKLNPLLKEEFKRSKIRVFDTADKQLMNVLETNKRQYPTENEKKLMEWNEAIYNQEKMKSTQTLQDELERWERLQQMR